MTDIAKMNADFHRLRFYKPQCRAINSVALHKRSSKLALLRSDSSIEIWNLLNLPFIERIIPFTIDQDVQELKWCGDRLFSSDLQGFLNEYDLRTLTIKKKRSVTGEAAYCLDVDSRNEHIAVGTEKGFINIFSVVDEEVSFEKFLDIQEGKVICIKYDKTSKFVVSGGVDAIRIFDVSTGHALHKMSGGRCEKNTPTIFWCLEVLDDFTIITGDSRGILTFWDGMLGAEIESHQSHRADILAIAMTEDEQSLFCAGIDPDLINFSKVKVKDNTHKWVKSIRRKAHDHDVKSLILFKDKLYSGGIDSYLACTFYPPKTLIKYPSFLQNNCITVCYQAAFILFQYPERIEVWKLNCAEKDISDNNAKPPAKKVVSIERNVKNSVGKLAKEGIVCSSMSHNGRWIAYSTINVSCVLEFEVVIHEEEVKLVKHSLTKSCGPCVRVAFTPDNSSLVLATISGHIVIYDLTEHCVQHRIDTNKYFKDTISFLLLPESGEYLVIGDMEGTIVVYKTSNLQKLYCKLPKYDCAPTAMCIGSAKNNLVVAYSDLKVVEYLLDETRYSDFSRSLTQDKLVQHIGNKHFPIRNITIGGGNEGKHNLILLHDDTTFIAIHPDTEASDRRPRSKKSKVENGHSHKDQKYTIRTFREFQHLVHLEWLSDREYVAVEVTPLMLATGLPPCLAQNTFGKK